MDWKKATKAFTAVTVLLIGVYDIVALSFGGVEATISRYIVGWPPAPIFALGYVMGHLTWPQKKEAEKDA